MLMAARSKPAMLEGLLNKKDRRLSSTRMSTSCAKALAAYLEQESDRWAVRQILLCIGEASALFFHKACPMAVHKQYALDHGLDATQLHQKRRAEQMVLREQQLQA